MARMMRSNFHRQQGRVEGRGASCASCKPDQWVGRAAEKAEWMRELDWPKFGENEGVQWMSCQCAHEGLAEHLRGCIYSVHPEWNESDELSLRCEGCELYQFAATEDRITWGNPAEELTTAQADPSPEAQDAPQ